MPAIHMQSGKKALSWAVSWSKSCSCPLCNQMKVIILARTTQGRLQNKLKAATNNGKRDGKRKKRSTSPRICLMVFIQAFLWSPPNVIFPPVSSLKSSIVRGAASYSQMLFNKTSRAWHQVFLFGEHASCWWSERPQYFQLEGILKRAKFLRQ